MVLGRGGKFGRKAQFFLIILVFMIVIIIGLAYYAVESGRLPQEIKAPPEKGTKVIRQIQSELMKIVEEKPFTGKNVTEYIPIFKNETKKSGYHLGANCTETQTGSYPNEYPTFNVECNLNLSWEKGNITTKFSHSYKVNFDIKTYSDPDLTTETDTFDINDTVYYKITGWTNDVVNFSAWLGSTLKNSQSHTLQNYYATGSFVVDEGGNWTLNITDTNTSEQKSKTIYVNQLTINLETQGQGSGWVPRDHFLRGEPIKVKVTVEDSQGNPVNVPVRITFTRKNMMATAGDYDTEGMTGSLGTAGKFEYTPTISSDEPAGTLTITAVELRYYSRNSTTVEIMKAPYANYTKLMDLPYNVNHLHALNDSCGYTDTGWYTSNSTSHTTSGMEEVPFYIEQTQYYDVVRLNNSVIEIRLPEIHGNTIHMVASKCDNC